MAKRKETSAERQEYGRFVLSPSSELFLRGKSDDEAYAREVRRVKSQLREDIYGERYDYEKEAAVIKKGVNGAALAVFLLAVLSVVMMLAGKINGLGGFLYVAEGSDAITLMADAIGGLTKSKPINSVTVIGLITAIALLFKALSLLGSVLIIKRKGVGKLLRAITFLAFLTDLAIIISELAYMQAVPAGIMILTVASFTSFLITALGKKKRR